MVEVVVSAIIFIIACYGILTTISVMRPHSVQSAQKLEAVYIAKQMLDDLRGQVDGRMWNNSISDLYPGTYSRTINGYTVSWNVADVPGLNLRQVNIVVTY